MVTTMQALPKLNGNRLFLLLPVFTGCPALQWLAFPCCYQKGTTTMKLNRQTIDTIRLPHGRNDLIVFDETLPGFDLRIRAGGSRKWVCQFELLGRQRRVTIGSTAVFNPDAARKVAREMLAKVRLGIDPQAQRREAVVQSKLTLRAVIDRYLNEKGPRLRLTTLRATRSYLLRRWQPLHHLPVHEIERRHVAANLGGAPVAAARSRDALSALFAWSIAEGLCEHNPTIGTRHPDEGAKPRDRILANEELASIWRACGDDDFGRIVRLLILTACRRQEVGGMRWSELDPQNGTWSIPAERTKNKRQHVLPLSGTAWAIITAVHHRPGNDHLFGRRGFTSWLEKAALDQRSGVTTHWTLHDFRRTAATGLANLGIQPHVIEQILNHASGHKRGVAGIYNRSPYASEVRSALAVWADHVRALVDGGEHKIIPMRG
jgi:integrase